jgi:hypothetical protein
MAYGRRRRIERLEVMLYDAMRPCCAGVTYTYGLAEIVAGIRLDDAVDAAIAEQGSHAWQCVALPSKISREDLDCDGANELN